jgi:hypothetical protein
VMSLVTNSFDHTSFRSLAGDIYARLLAKWTVSHLRDSSSTNTTSDMLPPWQSAPLTRSCLQAAFLVRIRRSYAWNWPPLSPDLNPLDYHVRAAWKLFVVYALKVNMTEERLSEFSAL